MITIECQNTGNILAKNKAIQLFKYANTASKMIKSGNVIISKAPCSDIFTIEYDKENVGNIEIIRKGNKIQNYIISLDIEMGVGYLKIPHIYRMRSKSSTDLSPCYEEWHSYTMKNNADLTIRYKIIEDDVIYHEYDVDVLNYGIDLKLKNINARLTRREASSHQDVYFSHLSLRYFAFTQQDIFIDLFGTNDFLEAMNSPKLQDNIDVLNMCSI